MIAPARGAPSPAERTQAQLDAARVRLVLERPFLGALVVHLPMTPSTRCRTMATDARRLWYNPAFVDALDLAETQFMLAHEALHCALGHHRRRGTRLARRWDVACDYAVNQLLVDDGLKAPIDALLDVRFRGLTAEAIYPLLAADDDAAEPLDEHWFDGGVRADFPASALASRPGDAEPGESLADDDAHRDGHDELASRAPTATVAADAAPDEWAHRLTATALEAAGAGRLGPHWASVLPDLAQPRLPWRALLARFLMLLAREDFSFARPSRRGANEGAILPGLASGAIDLVLALDTSGSVSREDFRQFVDEVDALKGQIRARITLLACDAELAPDAPWTFEAWQHLDLPEALGGGGSTRFTPVFEWVETQGVRPAALLYFTDAQGEFPAQAPAYPVLWLVKGNAPVPFGERVQLN